jgi:hypothetical protein
VKHLTRGGERKWVPTTRHNISRSLPHFPLQRTRQLVSARLGTENAPCVQLSIGLAPANDSTSVAIVESFMESGPTPHTRVDTVRFVHCLCEGTLT